MENNLDIFKGLPELKNAFWKNWEILNNIIWVDKIEEHFNNTIKTFEGLKKWAEDWIKATIDSAWEIIEKWWEIINQTWEVMNDVKDNVVEWAADLEGKAKDAIQDWLNDLFNINK
jgi:16S rRNA C967 or C1407 C5-methylase (RsmB/RsmF family)